MQLHLNRGIFVGVAGFDLCSYDSSNLLRTSLSTLLMISVSSCLICAVSMECLKGSLGVSRWFLAQSRQALQQVRLV